MKYQLILQWSAASVKDFNCLIEAEDALVERLEPDHEVDGHDFGSGQMNVFIHTDMPTVAFEAARSILESWGMRSDFRAAFRDAEGEEFTVLWPPGLAEFEVT